MWLILVSVLILIAGHFVGDFLFQTDKMATQKGKSNKVLLQHVGTYSLWIGLAGYAVSLMFGFSFVAWIAWWIVNAILHFVVDYTTSRANAKIIASKGMGHDFFLMIGFDQMLHAFSLVITLGLILL